MGAGSRSFCPKWQCEADPARFYAMADRRPATKTPHFDLANRVDSGFHSAVCCPDNVPNTNPQQVFQADDNRKVPNIIQDAIGIQQGLRPWVRRAAVFFPGAICVSPIGERSYEVTKGGRFSLAARFAGWNSASHQAWHQEPFFKAY